VLCGEMSSQPVTAKLASRIMQVLVVRQIFIKNDFPAYPGRTLELKIISQSIARSSQLIG
jgi:hypothetical protein